MRALVTGGDGFVARWLVHHLTELGDETWLGVGASAGEPADNARVIDVRSADDVTALVHWARPDAIYHLAAVAFGPDARRSIGDAVDVTVVGTANVLAAASTLDPPPIVLIPSSAEVYGIPDHEAGISERDLVRPVNAYGETKVAQEAVGLAYDLAGTVPVVVARAFNHIGPGQRDVFVVSSFATQLAGIVVRGEPATLRVGNLDVRRDFTDVRDVVRAYRLLLAGAHHGEPINVASGTATPIRDVLDDLIRLSGAEVTIEVDPSRLRSVDAPTIVGDATRLTDLTGWRPSVPLSRTLGDVWRDALDRVDVAGRSGTGMPR